MKFKVGDYVFYQSRYLAASRAPSPPVIACITKAGQFGNIQKIQWQYYEVETLDNGIGGAFEEELELLELTELDKLCLSIK